MIKKDTKVADMKYTPNIFGDKSLEIRESKSFKKFYSFCQNSEGKKNSMFGRLRIVITNFCNLNCKYCFNEGVPKNADFINTEDLDFILKSISKNIENIKITGGEPLLHPQIEEVLDLCCKYKKTSITTNGVLLKKHSAMLNRSKLTHIIISLDRPHFENFREGMIDPVKFNLIKEGIKSIKKTIGVNMVVTKDNVNEITDMISFCNKMGIKKLSLISLIKYGQDIDKIYISPLAIEKKLEKLCGEHKITGRTKKTYKFKDLVIDLVWQYCTLECNMCKIDGFIRITTDNKFKYCLGEKSEIDFSKELESRDSPGLSDKFYNAISMLGTPPE